jgi:hypothetical protein
MCEQSDRQYRNQNGAVGPWAWEKLVNCKCLKTSEGGEEGPFVKPLYGPMRCFGFESLPLRHTVWNVEKSA